MNMQKLLLIGCALGAVAVILVHTKKLKPSQVDANGNPWPSGTPDAGPGNPWFDIEHPWMHQ